jgi:putative transcriptional regulator
MNRIAGIARVCAFLTAVCAFLTAFPIAAAHAADLSQAVILVASQELGGSPFEQTVVIATPLPQGGHIGFIVNRPTTMKLETLFPDEARARNVKEPVYLGGPALVPAVFALMRSAPDGAGAAVPLMPGVVAIVDEATINRVIETTPNAARYFVGMMVWDDDELEKQVAGGLWEVRPAEADSVLPAKAPGLWNSLRKPMAKIDGSSFG